MIRTVLLAATAERLSMKLDSHQIAHLAPPAQQPATPVFRRVDFTRQEPAKVRAMERRQQRAVKAFRLV